MRLARSEFLKNFGGATLMTRQVLSEIFKPPLYLNLVIEQIYQIGVLSIPIMMVTAGSTGMVMALQFGLGLEKFGGKLYVPKIVSISIVREMGPVFTCLMLAARVGAGMASEIGSMTVTQQIDAIRALGTSPIKKIVIPRLLGCLIGIPILVVAANFIGILGALVVCANDLGVDPVFFVQKVLTTLWLPDFVAGISKNHNFYGTSRKP
jgi:phospholipid/cholesterol/gamma-HCH transport system permease protein